jgi:proteasome lid subunit RPN8/RPN11
MATSTQQLLFIPPEILDAMIAHCEAQPEQACCGILGGTPPRVSAVYAMRNIAEDPFRRYNAAPDDLIHANANIRDRGLSIAAIYHFCPGSPPVPSPTDLRENYYGELPRVILSLDDASATRAWNIRVWRLNSESFAELDWRVLLPGEDPVAGEPACRMEGPAVEPKKERIGEPASLRESLLSRAVRWLWPSGAKPNARNVDSAPIGRDPM